MNNYQSITASPEALAAFLGSIPAIETPWAKDIISYRCFAPGRCKGRVVGVKRFDPYIPAWCPKLKKNGGMKQ